MFCGPFPIRQIYASGLFHAITDVNVIVPPPSLAEECDEARNTSLPTAPGLVGQFGRLSRGC